MKASLILSWFLVFCSEVLDCLYYHGDLHVKHDLCSSLKCLMCRWSKTSFWQRVCPSSIAFWIDARVGDLVEICIRMSTHQTLHNFLVWMSSFFFKGWKEFNQAPSHFQYLQVEFATLSKWCRHVKHCVHLCRYDVQRFLNMMGYFGLLVKINFIDQF